MGKKIVYAANKEDRIKDLLKRGKMKVLEDKMEAYEKECKAQTNDLSKYLLDFSHAWAIAMQIEIDNGNQPGEVMDMIEVDLDYKGLSGFTYSICKNFLKEYWVYGHKLP